MVASLLVKYAYHELKIWPPYFQAIWKGTKTFEIRKDDRGFDVGHLLLLREWSPEAKRYTGSYLLKAVTYVMHGGRFGLEVGHVVMGLRDPVTEESIAIKTLVDTVGLGVEKIMLNAEQSAALRKMLDDDFTSPSLELRSLLQKEDPK